jgi:hypothetical protein
VRSPRFAREQDFFFSGSCCGDLLRLRLVFLAFFAATELFLLMLATFVVVLFMVLVCWLVFEFDVITERGDVQSIFVSGIRFRFRNCLRRADDFLHCRFVVFLFFFVLFRRFFF